MAEAIKVTELEPFHGLTRHVVNSRALRVLLQELLLRDSSRFERMEGGGMGIVVDRVGKRYAFTLSPNDDVTIEVAERDI